MALKERKLTIAIAPKRHPHAPVQRWILDLAKQIHNFWPQALEQLSHQASKLFHLEPDPQTTHKALNPNDPKNREGGEPLPIEEYIEFQRILQDLANLNLMPAVQQTVQSAYQMGVYLSNRGESAVTTPVRTNTLDLPQTTRYVDQQAIAYTQGLAMHAMRAKQSSQMYDYLGQVMQGLQRREHPSTIARAMIQQHKGKYADALRLARTITADALAVSSYQQTKQLGVAYVYIPENPTSCEHCKRLIDGRVFPLEAIEGASNRGKKQSQWGPAVPLHPNCTHYPIPASDWLIQQAKDIGKGRIPATGIKVKFVPPAQRTSSSQPVTQPNEDRTHE